MDHDVSHRPVDLSEDQVAAAREGRLGDLGELLEGPRPVDLSENEVMAARDGKEPPSLSQTAS